MTGKFQLYFESDFDKFPFYLLNDNRFHSFLNEINEERQSRKENRTPQGYKPSKELLQRAAQLQMIMHHKIVQKRSISRKKNSETSNKPLQDQSHQADPKPYAPMQLPVWGNVIFPTQSADAQNQPQPTPANNIMHLPILNNVTPINKRRTETNQQQQIKSQHSKKAQIRASQETARKMTEEFLRTLPHRAVSSTNPAESQQQVLPTPVFGVSVAQNAQIQTNNVQQKITETNIPINQQNTTNSLPLNIPLPLKKKMS